MEIQDTRYWAKVEKATEHWLWTGAVNHDGYGNLGRNGRDLKAHRYAWELATGETLTKHDTICHVCDIPNCVRNDDEGTYRVGAKVYPRRGHLYKATQPANVADRDAKERGHWATGSEHGTHTKPESVPRGEQNGNAKLTDAEIREIIRLGNGHYGNLSALARQFKVSVPLIAGILEGRRWQHIDRASIVRQPEQGPVYDSWTKHPDGCSACGGKDQRHKSRGLCVRCDARERMARKRAAGYIAPSRRK